MHWAKVIVTSSSDEKIERAKQMGAAHGVNYVQQPEWDKAVLKLTSHKGADLVVEVAGGENLGRSLQAAKIGGHIAMIGFLKWCFRAGSALSLCCEAAHARRHLCRLTGHL